MYNNSLNYLSIATRPDIAYAVSYLARAIMHTPTQADWNNAKRVLRYLKGTQQLALIYNKLNSVFGYSDDAQRLKKLQYEMFPTIPTSPIINEENQPTFK